MPFQVPFTMPNWQALCDDPFARTYPCEQLYVAIVPMYRALAGREAETPRGGE